MAGDATTALIAASGALAGVFGGGILQAGRERVARREERRAVREAEIDNFEREQVQRLQDKLLALVKCSVRINERRLDEFRKASRWPSVKDIGRDEEYVAARFETMAIAERMLVNELREAAWTVINRAARLTGAVSGTAEVLEIDLSASMSEAMRLLGARLGELYRRP